MFKTKKWIQMKDIYKNTTDLLNRIIEENLVTQGINISIEEEKANVLKLENMKLDFNAFYSVLESEVNITKKFEKSTKKDLKKMLKNTMLEKEIKKKQEIKINGKIKELENIIHSNGKSSNIMIETKLTPDEKSIELNCIYYSK